MTALVAALVAAGGAVFVFFRSDGPTLTYQGKAISNAREVLRTAEGKVASVVTARHGVSAPETRCYFAVPKQPASGAKKTDIDSVLRCGPVLFVDGDANRSYLGFTLSASRTAGKKITLAAADNPTTADPDTLDPAMQLRRPDGKKAPSGSGGLRVPQPPAAEKDVLTVAGLGNVPQPHAAPDTSRMVSQHTGVRLVAAGIVSRYGVGDEARSAPAGQRLLAFQIDPIAGEFDDQPPGKSLTVVVDGGTPRPVPDTPASDDFVLLAISSTATARLVLTDGGYTQSLALPTGKPGDKNIAVLARRHRGADVNRKADVTFNVSGNGGSGSDTVHVSFHGVALVFWAQNRHEVHASVPGKALLVIDLDYTDPLDPGKTFGLDASFLQLTLPNGTVVHARNIAPSGKVFDVFEVPGSFTTGTMRISGSMQQEGFTVSIAAPVSFPISIPAG